MNRICPIGERARELMEDEDRVLEILREGAKTAR